MSSRQNSIRPAEEKIGAELESSKIVMQVVRVHWQRIYLDFYSNMGRGFGGNSVPHMAAGLRLMSLSARRSKWAV